ncbi:MAG: hypothetical protein ACW98Y_13535 [Candidatus Thorarchaeota archaeon]|jgi:hypothetical protein
MSYIGRIKEELSGMSYHAIWQFLMKKTYGDYDFLVHPCTVPRETLRRHLPKAISVEEAIAKITLKQKELARRLNIPILPSDRQAGFIGQSALYEILQNGRYDLSMYFDNIFETQKKMWVEGFGLLQSLASVCYIRRYFNCPPLDLVKYVIEPLNPNTITILWDKNWMHRIITNIQSLSPFLPYNNDTYDVLMKLVRIQDARGANPSRVAEWTGKTRRQATRLLDVMSMCGLIHQYILEPKNTGLVRKFSKNTSTSKMIPFIEILCTSVDDGADYFITSTCDFKDPHDNKCLTTESFACNIENFNLEERFWSLGKPDHVANSIDDIYSLFHNSDCTVPENTKPITNRDIFYIAMLLSMPVENLPKKKSEAVRRISAGCGIPLDEVELGVRNILRKNLIRNLNTFIPSHDRQILFVLFDDTKKKTIPFLGKIIPSAPMTELKANDDMSCGAVFTYYPSYLSCDMRLHVESTLSECDVNGEIFIMKNFKRTGTAHLLSLIQDS